MRLQLLLLLVLSCICIPVYSTHLAGGDFELQHVNGSTYRLSLNLYFDEINGSPGARDRQIVVSIFEKGTNRFITSVTMPLRKQTNINYSIIECTTNDLKTSKILYYQDITLDPAAYTHPEGYYVSWERCCRNQTITNIASPESAGQTFYLEFPAVIRNGRPFINSSPKLPEPLSDYACLNELFYYNFTGIDADGDSLVYDLVDPLNGYSSPADNVPFANPAPYPPISWLAGYNKENQVPGSPALNIDRKTGRLTVKPSYKGLFVFGIRCQEFRNGVKIGEIRRDIQLLVKECLRNETPVVLAKGSNSTRPYNPVQIYRINKTGPRCLDILFTDPDKNERLFLTAKPVNFSNNYYNFSGQTQGMVNTGATQDSLKATLCFTDCFDTDGKTYLLDIIVSDYGDNGCGLPRQDTLRLSLIAERASNRPPSISLSTPVKVIEAFEGETIRFDVTGTDPDNDLVTVAGAGQGFTFGSQNIAFTGKNATGRASAEFSWLIDCQALQQPSYKIEFTATSGPCERVTATEIIEIRPKRKNITNNAIASEQLICYNSLPATITGSLPAGGTGNYTYLWEASTSGAQTGFTPAPGINNQPQYTPAALAQTTWFRRKVMAGNCNEHTSAAIAIKVESLPAAPLATSAFTCPGETVLLKAAAPAVGSELEWYDQPIGGMLLHRGPSYETPPLDASTDFYVQTVNRHGCASASRTNASATVLPSTADAGDDIAIIEGSSVGLKAKGGVTYAWSPAESLSNPTIANPTASPQKTTTYTVTVTTKEGCTYSDEVTVTVLPRIKPTNAISLNGDGINDTWFIENIEYYPKCTIQIYTRWGAKVFESTGYKEPWDGTYQGKQLPMAAYFYIIRLDESEKPISGSITLIK